MTKYHISEGGEPVLCKATTQSCPRGDYTEHFDTIDEAFNAIAAQFDGNFLNSSRRKDSLPQNVIDAEKYYGGRFISAHEIELDSGVEKALEDLREVGNPLIVGGAVRDSFEGHDNKDIDIEVHGTDIDSIVKLLRKKGYHVDEVGKEFGVLKASKGAVTDLDIAVPRKENRTGAGHRNFEVELDKTMTVSEAAERRDFTFNSVMYDPARKVIIDPAGGHEDFENKTMRHVSEKFAEDPLRVLRGFQFAGRFGMTYHPDTAELCKNLRSEYSSISVERVREEWNKFYTKSKHPELGVSALQQSGWDDMTPGLRTALTAATDDLRKLPEIPKDHRSVVGTALIAQHMDDDDHYGIMDISLGSNDERRKAKILLESDADELSQNTYYRKMWAHNASGKKTNFKLYESWAIATDNQKALKAVRFAKAEGVFEKPEPILVNGNEVMALTDKKAGPWMSQVMEGLREKQYRGEIRTKAEALRFAKDLISDS